MNTAQTPGSSLDDVEQNVEETEQALAPGERPPIGRFSFDLASKRWSWSDEIYVMHGFEPGQVVPTTELMLSHKHPDDRDRVDGVLRRAVETGQPFSSVHRIIDAKGATRTLAITGQARRDPVTGQLTELFGYFLDATRSHRQAAARDATASIQASSQSRAAIEQAKGVLMAVYGIEEEAAFDRLRQASNDANIPVRKLAETLVDQISEPGVTVFPPRASIDTFLASPTSLDGA